MTHAEMMAEMLAARRESAHALDMLAQAIGGFVRGGPGGDRSLYRFRYMFIFIPLFNYRTLNPGIVINNFQELLLYEMD